MENVAKAIEQAIASNDFGAIGELFADDVTWGDCAGKGDARAFLSAVTAELPAITGGAVNRGSDRLVAAITIDGVGGDNQISEIIDAPDADQAMLVRPVGPLPAAADRLATMARVAPVLPVAEVNKAVAHYRALGFTVHSYDGDAAYGFAARDGVELHLAQVSDVDPKTNMSAAYLYVDDADALYSQWRHAEVAGRLVAPQDTDYGLREGAHVDPDGNLLRFGSEIGA